MCKLCQYDKGFRPDLIILDTELSIVMANLFPLGELSFLILPKRHMSSVSETTTEEYDDLNKLIKIVISKIEENDCDYNVWFNKGEKAGQSIPHLHYHIAVKTEDDGVEIKRIKTPHELSFEELQKMRKNILS